MREGFWVRTGKYDSEKQDLLALGLAAMGTTGVNAQKGCGAVVFCMNEQVFRASAGQSNRRAQVGSLSFSVCHRSDPKDVLSS